MRIDADPGPAIFFYINGKFEFHTCELDAAELYGNFLVYPSGHYDLWNNEYIKKHAAATATISAPIEKNPNIENNVLQNLSKNFLNFQPFQKKIFKNYQ